MYLDVIPRKPLQWRYLVFRAPRIERKTSEEGAKEYLIVAQEKYDQCRKTKAELKVAAAREVLAGKVFANYGEVSTKALEAIYDSVCARR